MSPQKVGETDSMRLASLHPAQIEAALRDMPASHELLWKSAPAWSRLTTAKAMIEHLDRTDPAGYLSAMLVGYVALMLEFPPVDDASRPPLLGLAELAQVTGLPGLDKEPQGNRATLREMVSAFGRSHAVLFRLSSDGMRKSR